jgi:glyoxylase-like metal-dependent hydrolase (beta-lactamase superfamily II)
MKLHVINSGMFMLDGGAMFGVVPKSIWNKLNPADDNNMCNWAMRCLLVEDGKRLILIDTGIGNKQDQRFFNYFFLHGEDTLLKSLQKAGFSPGDITDVLLTHLHFDHCGGALTYNQERTKVQTTFPNAIYWSNEDHWKWATQPNVREKASFLPENIIPLQQSGQLKFIGPKNSPFENIDLLFVDGHTDKQMIPHIRYKDKTIVFVADLFPSVGHLPLPYVMAYDTRPLLTLKEKEVFLNKAIEKKFVLFFEHDPVNECCSLQKTERGIRLDRIFPLQEIL